MTGDEEAVVAANDAFYAAFEARDLDAMAEVWERTDRATVTHPAWPTLRGWPRVAASWDAIFRNTGYIQFFLTDHRVDVHGDTAWVTVYENILQAPGDDAGGGEEPGGGDEMGGGLHGSTVAAVNVFVRTERGWRIVVHHGSPVLHHQDG